MRYTDHLYIKKESALKKGAETAEKAAGYTFFYTVDSLNKILLNNYEILFQEVYRYLVTVADLMK